MQPLRSQNVTGRNLSSSMTTLLGTLKGTTTQLRKMVIDLKGITDEELRQGAAIDVVIGQLVSYSDEMAKPNSSHKAAILGFMLSVETDGKPSLEAIK